MEERAKCRACLGAGELVRGDHSLMRCPRCAGRGLEPLAIPANEKPDAQGLSSAQRFNADWDDAA